MDCSSDSLLFMLSVKLGVPRARLFRTPMRCASMQHRSLNTHPILWQCMVTCAAVSLHA